MEGISGRNTAKDCNREQETGANKKKGQEGIWRGRQENSCVVSRGTKTTETGWIFTLEK